MRRPTYRLDPAVMSLTQDLEYHTAALQIAQEAHSPFLACTDPRDIRTALDNRMLVLIGDDLAQAVASAACKIPIWDSGALPERIDRFVMISKRPQGRPQVPTYLWRIRAAHCITLPLTDAASQELQKIVQQMCPF